jgi:hypothetical protein
LRLARQETCREGVQIYGNGTHDSLLCES